MTSKRTRQRYFWIVFVALLVACGTFPPDQAVYPTPTNEPVFTLVPQAPTTPPKETPLAPSPMPTSTNTPTPAHEPGPLPACTIFDADGKLYVLNDDVFFAYGPSKKELDLALADNFPEWAAFRQEVSWNTQRETAGVVIAEASFQEKFALNPEVTLVTVGIDLDWKLPVDGNLYWPARSTGERLVRLWDEYSTPEHEAIRALYPEMANAATYTLYIFFHRDKAKLQMWCDTYQRLFKTSPLLYRRKP